MRLRDDLGESRFTPRRLSMWAYRFFRDRFLVARYSLRNRFSTSQITGAGPVAVSLTSYSHRVETVYLTIESIGCGDLKPSEVILYLDEARRAEKLPRSLERLCTRGLQIRFCPDYRSHKKYFPYALELQPTSLPLVTADDDVLYPRWWLNRLVLAANQNGQAPTVLCHRAHRMTIKDNEIAPYARWSSCTDTEASVLNVATGVGGVYYPIHLLGILASQGEDFAENFMSTDDLWLHLIGLRSGYATRQVSTRATTFPTVPGSQSTSLVSTNLLSGNDLAILNGYTKSDVAHVISASLVSNDRGNGRLQDDRSGQ